MLNYNEFIYAVEKDICSCLNTGESLSASVKDVIKNNSVVLKGLTIKTESENVAPTIYLEQFFEEYCHSGDYNSTLMSIAQTYRNSRVGDIPGFTADSLRPEDVYGELINTERNKELLKDVPSIPLFDGRFSVVFRYALDFMDSKGSVLVTDSIAESKGLNVEKLMELALRNKGAYSKASLQPMEDILSTLCGMEMPMLGGSGCKSPMYVLSNESNHYGAFAILRPETQKALQETFDGDIVVIPSSIHELILMSAETAQNGLADTLNEIITSVNTEVVQEQDILDNSYFVLSLTDEGYKFKEGVQTVA